MIIIAAILPAVVLSYYIYRRDPVKEPVKQLIQGFFYGIGAAAIALIFEIALSGIGLVSTDEDAGVLSSINIAFMGAAIPEELAKLLMLWLLLRHNKYFDEYYDGVVYAVSISMGFAAIENVLYLFQNIGNWQEVAVMRGLFSVPGHFAFAIIMGYFYSLVHIGRRHSRRDRLMVIIAPVLAHGAFDAILFVSAITDRFISSMLTLAFLLLCWKLVKVCKLHLRVLRVFDNTPSSNS